MENPNYRNTSALMKNRTATFITMLFALSCFVLLPKTQAVTPPPDGGYAGGNTAEIQKVSDQVQLRRPTSQVASNQQ
jgi:hypothetical protein